MDIQQAYAKQRRRLEAERQQLVGDISAIQSENQAQQDDAGIGNHLADDASDLMNRERNLALRGNAESLIDRIDGALQRIDNGTYLALTEPPFCQRQKRGGIWGGAASPDPTTA